MLKVNASYAKKVPAAGEYSSQSYHASIEMELADGLTPEQLQDKIHETFELVRSSVESELQSGRESAAAAPPAAPVVVAASNKQLQYLVDMARNHGVNPLQLAARFNVQDLRELTRSQCSKLIDELSGKAA